MIVSSNTKKPQIHASAYVAPSAVLSGDVTVEEGCAILHGAVISGEGAPVTLGANSVVMENAVLRASGGKAMQFPLNIGESCMIGPTAYVVGATLEPGVFIATGAKVFNGATIEENTSVALGAIVHVSTHLKSGQHVPMQHIAFGNPAVIYPPEQAGALRERLQFFETVFNMPSEPEVRAKATAAYAKFLRKTHAQDGIIVETVKRQPAKPTGKPAEPPPTQSQDVGKVVDVMFLELHEAEMRRNAKKQQ
ncbi:MAG: gamma carbonic anhydrase family protein [Candidatus Baltobacteraceae bacterium]